MNGDSLDSRLHGDQTAKPSHFLLQSITGRRMPLLDDVAQLYTDKTSSSQSMRFCIRIDWHPAKTTEPVYVIICVRHRSLACNVYVAKDANTAR
jgi:hypothetical protein